MRLVLEAQEGGECPNPPPPCTDGCGGGVETVQEFYYGVPVSLVAPSRAERVLAMPATHELPPDDMS